MSYTGASKDIQNNLDKNVGSPTKTFVKNIEAVPGSSTSVPGSNFCSHNFT